MPMLSVESHYWNAKLMKSDKRLASIYFHSFGQVTQCISDVCVISIFAVKVALLLFSKKCLCLEFYWLWSSLFLL